MAVNAARIVKATTNLYKGVTLPASNTFLTLVAGVPTSGIHCGAIGAIAVTPGLETEEKDSENQLQILGAAVSKNSLEIKVALKEWTTEGLSWLTGGRRQGAGFFGGSSTNLSYTTLCVVWELTTDVYAYMLAYKCYVSSPAEISVEKGSLSNFEATLTAVAETTREKSDQLFQMWLPDGYNDLL
jgi:hypothetical protein